AVGLIAATIYGVGWTRGYQRADSACEAAALRSRIEAMEADMRIAKDAEKLAQQYAAELGEQAKALEERVKDYEHELATRADAGACRLTPADIQRLRSGSR